MRSHTGDSPSLSKRSRLDAGTGTNKDRISSLPDDVISDILSCLPIERAVQTSVLAKDWKHKWTSIYNVNIDNGFPFPKQASDEVGTFHHFLKTLSRNSTKIQRFRFSRTKQCGPRLKKFLSDVLESKVETFDIYSPDAIVLPGSSFLSCTSLQTLVMDMVCNLKFSSDNIINCFPNLTHVYLKDVEFQKAKSGDYSLTLTFPVLQVFDMTCCRWSVLKFVEIIAPKLTMFRSMTSYEFIIDGDTTIKIHGARIVNFEISGAMPETFNLAGSVVSYADLGNDNDSTEVIENGLQVRRLLKELSSIESLKLSSFLLQGIAQTKSTILLPMFYKLRKLVLSSSSCEMWEDSDHPPPGNIEALLELLHATPVLKYLDIDVVYWDDYGDEDEDYSAMIPVPSCIVSHLEEVRLSHLKWSPQFLLAGYLLQEGAQLKKFSVDCDDEYGDVVKQLVSEVPKASSCLTLEIN